jgi:hypothetical protein
MDDENDNNNIPHLLECTEPSHEDINNESFLDSVFEKDCSTSMYIPKIKSLTPLKMRSLKPLLRQLLMNTEKKLFICLPPRIFIML